MEDPESPFLKPQARLQERTRKREALLRAAVQMFNERGFHATSLEDVAARLGVTKPTIYHYFGSKENILLECVETGIKELSDAATNAGKSPAGTGLERLKVFLIRYAEINMEDFGRCVIRTPDEVLSPEGRRRFRKLKAKIDQSMRVMIRDGVEDGSIEVKNEKIAAFAIAGALNWPARWFNPNGSLSTKEVADAIVEIVFAGLQTRRKT